VVEAQLRLAGNHLAGLFDRDRREQPGCVKTTRSRLENKQDWAQRRRGHGRDLARSSAWSNRIKLL